LHSSLNNINWMNESDGEDSSETGAENTFQKFCHSGLNNWGGNSGHSSFGSSESWHWHSHLKHGE
jgi:hypothetical protein